MLEKKISSIICQQCLFSYLLLFIIPKVNCQNNLTDYESAKVSKRMVKTFTLEVHVVTFIVS